MDPVTARFMRNFYTLAAASTVSIDLCVITLFNTRMETEDDFSLCMMANARMAARAVSRRYDRQVRPFGLKAAQFAVLGLVKRNAGATMADLAELVSMDRTTLLRNLVLLDGKGLVTRRPAASGVGKSYDLTPAGDALVIAAIPAWRRAQTELEAELSPETFADAIKILQRLSTV